MELYSTCCGAPVQADYDLCVECLEHCDAHDEANNNYEFSVNKWVRSDDQTEN